MPRGPARRKKAAVRHKADEKHAVKKTVVKHNVVGAKKRRKRKLSDTELFERIVFRRHTFLPVDQWRSLMERRQAAVCQIRIGTQACGTGFLVAQDVVLTNHHVVSDKEPTSIRITFDVRGGQAAPADTYRLASDWLVESSNAQDLDYALLRLSQTPNPPRPWINLSPHKFEDNEPLIIIQHPQGTDLKLAFGMFHEYHGKNRVAYLINTDYGSSGSPCLAPDLRLVALHAARHPNGKHNVGILASKILKTSKFEWPDELALPISQTADSDEAGSGPQERLAPAVVARFTLDKGVPEYDDDAEGWLLELSVEPKPDRKARVSHTLRDFWSEGKHETLSVGWRDGFRTTFTSYGDLSIVTAIAVGRKRQELQVWLSDALKKAHAHEWNKKIEAAIDDMRRY